MSSLSETVQARWDSLTKPRGSLGRLETEVVKLARIQGKVMPQAERLGMYVFCGDHGITAEGVSLYPSVVTREMMKNFVRGGAAINVLCRQFGIETRVVDAGVMGPKMEGVMDRRIGEGTRNFLREPAMSQEQATLAMESGKELAQAAAERFDLVGIGEMGIGNSTSASALLCVLGHVKPEDAAGRGTGLDEAGVQHKCKVLAAALAARQVDGQDTLAVLATFGGFEIAMMAGFLLGAAQHGLPVMVDGFISGAAFLVGRGIRSDLGEHCFFAHRSAERGHACLLKAAGANPLLDLGFCLGEGTGAAMAMGILCSGVRLYREMATFAEASVSDVV